MTREDASDMAKMTTASPNYRPIDHEESARLLAEWQPAIPDMRYHRRADLAKALAASVERGSRAAVTTRYEVCRCAGFYLMQPGPPLMQPEVARQVSTDDASPDDVVQIAIDLSRETGDLPVRVAVTRQPGSGNAGEDSFFGYVELRASQIED